MSKPSYTHKWDRLFKYTYKTITFICAIAAISVAISIYDKIGTPLHGWSKTIFEWIVIISGFILVPKITKRLFAFYWIATYLYVRSLGIRLTKEESKKASCLFIGDWPKPGVWFPLKELQDIEPLLRKEAFCYAANSICEAHSFARMFDDSYFEKLEFARSTYSQASSQNENQNIGNKINEYVGLCLSILGLKNLPKDFDTIKVSYREKMKACHPDRFAQEGKAVAQEKEELAKQLNMAYDFLTKYHKAISQE